MQDAEQNIKYWPINETMTFLLLFGGTDNFQWQIDIISYFHSLCPNILLSLLISFSYTQTYSLFFSLLFLFYNSFYYFPSHTRPFLFLLSVQGSFFSTLPCHRRNLFSEKLIGLTQWEQKLCWLLGDHLTEKIYS